MNSVLRSRSELGGKNHSAVPLVIIFTFAPFVLVL